MCGRDRNRCCYVVACMFPGAIVFGQNVDFQIVPFPGTTVNPGLNPVVVIQPGAVVPFQVVATVTSNQAATTAGLASFDFGVTTNFGVAQTTPLAFGPAVSPIFTVNQNLGIPIADDVLGIAGGQDIGSTGNISTGFAAGTQQVIATGQLLAPSTEGTFVVDLAGNATIFNTSPFLTTVPATTTTTGFTVVTQFPSQAEPVEDTDGIRNPQEPIQGGPSGPMGPIADGDSGEQVAGETPDGPPLTRSVGAGCGFGAASAGLIGLLGLGLFKRSRF